MNFMNMFSNTMTPPLKSTKYIINKMNIKYSEQNNKCILYHFLQSYHPLILFFFFINFTINLWELFLSSFKKNVFKLTY